MSTTVPTKMDLSIEEHEEQQAVLDKFLHGKPVPPLVERRIRERAARITAEIFQTHGLLDVAVPAIRELRDGLPDA
jgi:hypothetical protein